MECAAEAGARAADGTHCIECIESRQLCAKAGLRKAYVACIFLRRYTVL